MNGETVCRYREINEDYTDCIEKDNAYLFAVADGLGGHGKGEIASKLAVETSLKTFDENNLSNEEFLRECIEKSQENLLHEQEKIGKKDEIKTTLALVVIDNNSVRWAHVGDSRIYLFRNKKVFVQTKDHSVPQMLVTMGKIKEKDIRNHEDRNRLLKVLGNSDSEQKLKYEISENYELNSGDSILMCTDGFWELINEKQMIKFISSPEEWMKKMEKVIWKNGRKRNMDNFSAIAIRVE